MFSPFQHNCKNSNENTARQSKCCYSRSDVDHTTMVPYVPEDVGKYTIDLQLQYQQLTSSQSSKQNTSIVSKTKIPSSQSFRELISLPRISKDTRDIILSSWRETTTSKYSSTVNKWKIFCAERKEDPIYTSVNTVLEFLTFVFKSGVSYSTICGTRSALASIVTLSDSHCKLSDHPLIGRFVKGVYHMRPPLPRYTHTWDVNLIFDYWQQQDNNSKLSIMDLSSKTAILLLLLSGHRCSTLLSFDIDFMDLSDELCIFYPHGLLKHSTPNRKHDIFKFKKFDKYPSLCPVRTITEYYNRREQLNTNSSSFFITCKKPYNKPAPDTISRWVRRSMLAAGVDINIFKPHSCRSASNSKGVHTGVSIDQTLKHGSWSNVNTFLKFYFRPIMPNDTDDNALQTKLLGSYSS